jgi:hypothetical protein
LRFAKAAGHAHVSAKAGLQEDIQRKPTPIQGRFQTLLTKAPKAVWVALTALATLVTLLGVYVLRPDVLIEPYASTDPSRPFAQQFSIQNVSAYTIRDIWPLCGFGYDSGFNLRGLSLAGSMVDRLEPGAKTTLACSIATGPIRTDMERPVKPFWGAEILVLCFLRRGRACNVPAGAARRDHHLAGTARSRQGRAGVWRGEANP